MEIRVTPCMGLHNVSNPTKKRKGDWTSVKKVGDFEDRCGGQKQGKDPMAAVPVGGCVDFFLERFILLIFMCMSAFMCMRVQVLTESRRCCWSPWS